MTDASPVLSCAISVETLCLGVSKEEQTNLFSKSKDSLNFCLNNYYRKTSKIYWKYLVECWLCSYISQHRGNLSKTFLLQFFFYALCLLMYVCNCLHQCEKKGIRDWNWMRKIFGMNIQLKVGVNDFLLYNGNNLPLDFY